jgi:PPOX class probable F420-dependent enzyme
MIGDVTTPLSDLARRLVDEPTFAVVSTTNPDGAPQASVIWVKRDGDDILFSTIRGRRKTRNMERDPRVSVVLYDPADPYRYVEVRGTVSLTENGGRALIDELSLKYDGVPFPVEDPERIRVVVRVHPERVVGRG